MSSASPEALERLLADIQSLEHGDTARLCFSTPRGDVFTVRVQPSGCNLRASLTHQDSSLRYVTVDALFVSPREDMRWLCQLIAAVGVLGPLPTVSVTRTHRTLRNLSPVSL